jgi:hypothetical protein
MYTVALGERDFESCSLLPQGEGLGMREDATLKPIDWVHITRWFELDNLGLIE